MVDSNLDFDAGAAASTWNKKVLCWGILIFFIVVVAVLLGVFLPSAFPPDNNRSYSGSESRAEKKMVE